MFFENHNREPEHAEMHYLPHNVEETRWFFDAIRSPHFKWAFNVGAHELATTASAPVSGSIVVSHLVSMRAATAASASRQPCNATSPGLGMCPAAPAVARATDPYPGIRSLRRLARPGRVPSPPLARVAAAKHPLQAVNYRSPRIAVGLRPTTPGVRPHAILPRQRRLPLSLACPDRARDLRSANGSAELRHMLNSRLSEHSSRLPHVTVDRGLAVGRLL